MAAPLLCQNAFYEALTLSQIDENEIGKYEELLNKKILTDREKKQLKKVISFRWDTWLYVKTHKAVPIGILKIVDEKLRKKIEYYREQNDHESADELEYLLPKTRPHELAPPYTGFQADIPSNFMNKTL